MAHHTRIRAPGLWTDFSVLLAAEMELFDQRQFADVDGDAGGTWAPAAPIIVGGSGLHATGPLTADDLDGHIKAGKTLTVDANGTIAVGPGTLGNPAEIVVGQYGGAVWKNGGTAEFQATTTALFESGSVLQLNAGSNLTAAGSITFPNGSSLTQAGAAIAQLSGITSIESGGVLNVKAGATNTNASVLGVQFTGVQPVVTADPGANNIAIGLNQGKAWGFLTSDGSGGVVCADGMNVASVALTAGNDGWVVTFARPMASTNYSVGATYQYVTGMDSTNYYLPKVYALSVNGFEVRLYNVTAAAVATVNATKLGLAFNVKARQ